MAKSVADVAIAGLQERLAAFVLERFPFALGLVQDALDALSSAGRGRPATRSDRNAGVSPVARIEDLRTSLRKELARRLTAKPLDLPDPTPRVTARTRLEQARDVLLDACDGFLQREAIAASLTAAERQEILRGMVLTRAVDNRLKQFFLGGEVRYGATAFQGKGFRSLGQEAIYAAAIRLRRGSAWRDRGRWRGDVAGPIIRDVGVALAMRPEPATVRMVLNAQLGKQGPPMDGKDLHIGDFDWGILPATAPLSISTLSIAGIALAFSRDGSQRVAVSFI